VSGGRFDVEGFVDALLAGTNEGDVVTLDAIGEAIGTRLVTQDEIDAILTAVETRGRRVPSPESGRGEADLAQVIGAARTLRAELGRPPRPDEIAARTQIAIDDVKNALALVRIIQR
jgi:hypothetical protein